MIKKAFIDTTKKYRYMLMRQWGNNKNNFVNFVMLNPSTADGKIDDPTIKSCIRLAVGWGCDGFYVTNLFALRARDPEKLKVSKQPIGEENDKYIEKYAKISKKVVVAWGNNGTLDDRANKVLEKLQKITTPHCLGCTVQGQPRHPLFVRGSTKLEDY